MRRVGRLWRALLLIAASAGIAPAAEPLARYFPRRDLVAYVEYDGIDAHSEAWKTAASPRILDETPTGAMLRQGLSRRSSKRPCPTRARRFPRTDVASFAPLLRGPASAFAAINRKPDDPSAKPIVHRPRRPGGTAGASLLKKIIAAADLPAEVFTPLVKPGGRKLTLLGGSEGPGVAWWVEKDDLVFSLIKADYADAMIAALDGKEPNAVDHPHRVELAASADGFEPVGLAFLDMAALPKMPPEAADFGLDGIKRVDIKWGYQGEALMTVLAACSPSPPQGVLAMFDQPHLRRRVLSPRYPTASGAFTGGLARPAVKLVRLPSSPRWPGWPTPRARTGSPRPAGRFRKETGRRLREDVLSQVGPRLVFADVPTQVFATSMARPTASSAAFLGPRSPVQPADRVAGPNRSSSRIFGEDRSRPGPTLSSSIPKDL